VHIALAEVLAENKGGVVYRRAVEVPFSKSHLLERMLSAENIRRVWKQVRANKGAPGIQAAITSLYRKELVCFYGIPFI